MKKSIELLMLIFLFLILFFVFFGCQKIQKQPQEDIKQLAIEKCKELCEKAKKEIKLNSQCLSDLYEWQIQDWVCDIAHWPREEIDNVIENQCQKYREGKANHFVELDENCSFIRAF